MLRVYDDFLTEEEQDHVLDYCEGASYRYGAMMVINSIPLYVMISKQSISSELMTM